MKELVIKVSDEDLALLEEEYELLKDRGIELDSLEESIIYAATTHCRTMKAAFAMMNDLNDIQQLSSDTPVPVGVVPIHLNGDIDKDDFGEYLSDVLNQAIDDYNNNNNGPVN